CTSDAFFDLRSVRIVMLKTLRPDTISHVFGGVRNMVSGFARATISLLIISSLGCSTEDTGLVPVDAGDDPTNSAQGLEPDASPAHPKLDAKPTVMPDAAPDAPIVPDAPV